MKKERRGREDDGFSSLVTSCSKGAVDMQTGEFAYMFSWHHATEDTRAK